MATGDKVSATRPQGQSNMRLDLVDYAAMALTAQLADEAVNRSLIASPKATAGVATGERWTGSITANPTNGTDGLVRLDSAVFVGLDANGGMVIKPNGTALSVAIPAGGTNQQVYAYVQDVAENTQVRRFLPATSPFNEFANAINVALRQTVGLYVRAGALGSVVAQDAVAGITRALLFLGIATNTGGVVTFTPGTNMLETVRAPASFPTTDSGTTTVKTTTTGSQSTVRELVNAALYLVGNAMFKGSDFVTPADGNNWGAYSIASLSGGADKAFRGIYGYVTIGNGTTVMGDFNTNAFANSKLLMDAAFAALPAQGGTIIIKRGVALSGWGGVTCNAPNNKTVYIVGDHSDTPNSAPQISWTTGESITAAATASIVFQNLHIRFVQNGIILNTSGTSLVRFMDCYIDKVNAADTGGFCSGSNVSDVHFERCSANISVNAGTANGMLLRATGTCNRITGKKLKLFVGNLDMAWFQFGDMRADIDFEDIAITDGATATGATASVGCFTCASSDNATIANVLGRRFHKVINGTSIPTFFLTTAGQLTITGLDHRKAATIAINATAYTGSGFIRVFDSYVASISIVGAVPDFKMYNCVVSASVTIGDIAQAIGTVLFEASKWTGTTTGTPGITVNSLTLSVVRVVNCHFDGFSSTTTADWGIVKVRAAAVTFSAICADTIEFIGNLITNMQNIAYTGADATLSPRAFEVDTGVFRTVTCVDNTATNIMRSSSGNARKMAYLLDINAQDRTTNNNNTASGVVVCSRNRVGFQDFNAASADNMGLLKTARMWAQVWQIESNSLEIRFDNAAGTVTLDHIVQITNLQQQDCLHFCNNVIRIYYNAIAAMTTDVLKVITGTGGIQTVTICNNQFMLRDGFSSFNLTTAWGINIQVTINNLTVLGNTVSEGTASSGAILETKFATVTRGVPSAPPAPGVAWGSNQLLFGG